MKYKEEKLTQFIKNHLGGDLALAKEQREFVWDSRNLIQLLDSICRGIPMGAVIFGRGQTNAKDAETRKSHPVSNHAPIIFDGQQRMLSLKNVFVHKDFVLPRDKLLAGRVCRIWVDVDNFFSAIDSAGKEHLLIAETKKRKNPSLLRFKYRGGETGCYPFEVVPDEVSNDGFRNFKLFGKICGPRKTRKSQYEKTGKAIQKFVKEKRTFGTASVNWVPLKAVLNMEVGKRGCPPMVVEKAAKIGKFIRERIKEYRVCICEIGKDSDIDNLFLRINRAGQPVSDDEQYFAKLQQRWPEVEGELVRLHGKGTPFGLLDAVRLIVLIAHNINSEQELNQREAKGVYLRLQLRDFNESIVSKIRKVLEKKEQIEFAIKTFTEALSKAGLGYGVHLIDKKLMSIAMASAISDMICGEQKELPAEGSQSWRQLARYLFVVDQSGVLSSQAKNTHLRKIFKTMWVARFPQSVQYRDEFSKRCNQKGRMEPLLWLSVIQQIPLDRPRDTFDIDHIVPCSWKKKKGVVSELRNSIEHNLGNMWIVQRRKNREWQAVRPGQKFNEVGVNSDIPFGCNFETMRVDPTKFDWVKGATDLVDTKNADSLHSAIETRERDLRGAVLAALSL